MSWSCLLALGLSKAKQTRWIFGSIVWWYGFFQYCNTGLFHVQPGNHSVILYSMDCQCFFLSCFFFNAADLDHMALMTLVAVGHYAVVKNSVHKSYLIINYQNNIFTVSSEIFLNRFLTEPNIVQCSWAR